MGRAPVSREVYEECEAEDAAIRKRARRDGHSTALVDQHAKPSLPHILKRAAESQSAKVSRRRLVGKQPPRPRVEPIPNS